MSINILSGGKMGDFIHQLFAVKNICEREGKKANLFIGGGDPFKYGLQKAYVDLFDLVMRQSYINSFSFYSQQKLDYNLNHWRIGTLKNRHATGKYDKCWSDLLMETYLFKIQSNYKWIEAEKHQFGKILVHRSKDRHNDHSDIMNNIFTHSHSNVSFITSDISEYNLFEFKNKCEVILASTINDMAIEINSCKLFIGNQSMPFALASALDVPRICELDYDAAPFYMGEEKYSKNIAWMLNDITKYETFI